MFHPNISAFRENMYLGQTNQPTSSSSSQHQPRSSTVPATPTQTVTQRPPKEAPWKRSNQNSRPSRRDSSPPPPYEVANRLQRAVSRTDPEGGHPHTELEARSGARQQPRRSQRSAGKLDKWFHLQVVMFWSLAEIQTLKRNCTSWCFQYHYFFLNQLKVFVHLRRINNKINSHRHLIEGMGLKATTKCSLLYNSAAFNVGNSCSISSITFYHWSF